MTTADSDAKETGLPQPRTGDDPGMPESPQHGDDARLEHSSGESEKGKKSGEEKAEEEYDRESMISVVEAESKRSRSSSTSSSDSSNRSRSHSRNRSETRSARSRARSFLSRSLSRRRTRTRSRPPHAAGPSGSAPLTKTVSEVRDGVLYRRDVDISDADDSTNRGDHTTGGDIKAAPNRDLEKGLLNDEKHEASATNTAPPSGDEPDRNLVQWQGPDDPENPKNWPMKKKWASTFVISVFTLISPVSSSMIAPALTVIGRELNIPGSTEQVLTMSIFLLAFAIGPLFVGPLSELYGRVIVLQVSNLLYLFFNLGCGLARTKGQMIAFRFLAGFGGSAPLAIGGGVLGDLFTAEQRGRAMSMYSLMPLLGPAIGPIAGAFVTQNTSWRWVFHATTIADAVIQVAGLFFLRETYAPVLLSRKRDLLVKQTGNTALYTVYDKEHQNGTLATLSVALRRPFIMLGTQLIIQVLALYMMYLYGLMYLQLATFPTLWTQHYHERVGIAGLNYIAPGVGFFLGAQILAPTQDRIYKALKRHYGVSVGRPEFRVPLMVPGAIMVPIGLLIYGWCAEAHTHWIGPNIGIAITMGGLIAGFQCIQGYLVDTYTRYAASAVGATTVMRSLAGFGFPLFAPDMFAKLGYGKGNTVLAAIGIVLGWPAPFILWRYGQYLRQKSPYSVA